MAQADDAPTHRPRVALIGECMVEIARRGDDAARLGFGGDTLNTAIYLARLGVAVDYVTALGDDGLSAQMLAAWAAEGVGTTLVARRSGRVPGLYMIETDPAGERHFLYWRNEAPARELFTSPDTPALATALLGFDILYLSGISLAIIGEAGRARLFDILAHARSAGAKVVFDTNWRPRLWPDIATARRAHDQALALSDIALPGLADMRGLHGDDTADAVLDRLAGVPEVVVKLDTPGCVARHHGVITTVPAIPVDRVVDTTAAGDSFSAGYLAARLNNQSPEAAARAGHRLAAAVIQHPGAIIPKSAMPRPEGQP